MDQLVPVGNRSGHRTFETGFNGWAGEGGLGWNISSNSCEVTFNQLPFPFPELASLGSSTNEGAALFLGDYNAGELGIIGFQCKALDVLPSDIKVEWTDGSNVYFQSVLHELTSVGDWHYIDLPIAGYDAPQWQGDASNQFAQTLTQVQQIYVRILRNGAQTQRYQLDRVYVDKKPEAQEAAADPGGLAVLYDFLDPERTYAVETKQQLHDPEWTEVDTFAPLSRQDIYSHSVSNQPRSFYRLKLKK